MKFIKVDCAFANFSVWLPFGVGCFQHALGFAQLNLLVNMLVSCILCRNILSLFQKFFIHSQLLYFLGALLKLLCSSSHHLLYYGFLSLQKPMLRSGGLFFTSVFSTFYNEEPEVSIFLRLSFGLLCIGPRFSKPVIAKILSKSNFSSLITCQFGLPADRSKPTAYCFDINGGGLSFG